MPGRQELSPCCGLWRDAPLLARRRLVSSALGRPAAGFIRPLAVALEAREHVFGWAAVAHEAGRVLLGVDRSVVLAEMQRGIRFDTVGLGLDQDSELLTTLSAESGGIAVMR